MGLRLAKHLIFVTGLFTFLVACSSSSNELMNPIAAESANQDTASQPSPDTKEAPDGEDNANLISFENEILPIIENACALCHTGRGPGVPHAKLDTAAEVSAYAFAIGAVVDSGYMPPWPASDLSVPFLHDASLNVQQRELIVEWVRAGAPVDVDSGTQVTPTQEVPFLVSYDQELSSANFYDGVRGQPDEYRCFIFDPELTETKYLTGYEFIPDQTEVVHHLVGYRVTAEYREAADRKDAKEDQGGWSCFGSTGLGSDEILTFWGPGTGAIQYQEGLGLEMNPGDFFVMQIHYHYDVEAPEDRSTFRTIWSTDSDTQPINITTFSGPAEIPCAEWEEGPLCHRDNAYLYAEAQYDGIVQADEILEACGYTPEDFAEMTNGIASSTCDQPARFEGYISAVLGHQHNIGASFRMTLNPETPAELILLDIPDWDFEWQFAYYPQEEIYIERDDVIRLECVWDRSLRPNNLEPSYVLWADGSNDEMCFAVIMSYQMN